MAFPSPNPPNIQRSQTTNSQDAYVLSLSTNDGRNLVRRSELVGATRTAEMRVDDPKKHRVLVPTNAVWQTTPRKGPGPGVKIAFP